MRTPPRTGAWQPWLARHHAARRRDRPSTTSKSQPSSRRGTINGAHTDNYAIGSAPCSGSRRLKPIGYGLSSRVSQSTNCSVADILDSVIFRRRVAQRLRRGEGQQGAGYYVRCVLADVFRSTRRRVSPTVLRHQRRRRHPFNSPTDGQEFGC